MNCIDVTQRIHHMVIGYKFPNWHKTVHNNNNKNCTIVIVIYAELDNKRDGNSAFRMHENRRLCIANESPSGCQTEMQDSAQEDRFK